ncbi:M14 family zinc carboxypeptidase [Kinneretia aquatilis]|uniref:M14 family zinc carboxypeptidase n=1 Tax=Kinneretia aquatilis TaxID=2070761 RepID=UPI0014951C16|nr:M14 family zinc carboxypeptidase [Paucibacter aquatile]WIW00012.1 M14 family zinc carboxypeptidase [Paucibacter aquatile]
MPAIRPSVWLLTSMFSGLLLAPSFTAQAHDAPVNPASAKASAAENVRTVYRAYFKDLRLAQGIAHSRFDTLESKYELGYLVVLADANEARELRALGFRLQVDEQWLPEQQAQAARESAELAERRRSLGKALVPSFAGIPSYSCYPTVEEVFAEGDALIAAKPQLARWVDIGDSWQKTRASGGYDLRVLKLGNSAGPTNKPRLFVNAGIHAREYTTTPLVLEFAKRLVNGYGVDADATWILDHHEIHLLLATNPDGRKKAESGLLWRKNTNTAYCGATSNSRGADLNRNFTFQWNSTNGAGSSGSACNETYRGPSAASEPETQAVEAYIRSLWPDRRGPNRADAAPLDTSGIHLDIHSHGRLLLWPWGTNGVVAGNDKQLATLGRKFAYWNNHTPQRSLSLYETDGTSDGPSYGELGVAAFTFELGTAFFEQCSYYNSTVLPGNLPALIYAAKVVRTPYQTPAGPDVLSLALAGNASSSGVPAGTQVALSATVDDSRYNNSNGAEPTQAVAAAEAYIDTPPWVAGATPRALQASDGSFNSSSEAVRASLDTTGLAPGKHLVYVRGRDAAGNWGALSAVFLNISDGSGGTAPVAAFDTSINGLNVSFTDRSSDADGSIASRSWNFGDGATSSAANPSHAYAAAGSYTVSLTVTDNEGKSNSLSKPLVLSADGVPVLSNGQTVSGLSGARGSWRYYKLAIPSGARNLVVKGSGGSGDMDLYTQNGSQPSLSSYSCRKNGSTNTETCSIASPVAGWVYIGLYAYAAYSGLSLNVSFTP